MPSLGSNLLQNAEKGFLLHVLRQLRRADAPAQFEEQEPAEICSEMLFHRRIAFGETPHVFAVETERRQGATREHDSTEG